jgi:hypothetical protein
MGTDTAFRQIWLAAPEWVSIEGAALEVGHASPDHQTCRSPPIASDRFRRCLVSQAISSIDDRFGAVYAEQHPAHGGVSQPRRATIKITCVSNQFLRQFPRRAQPTADCQRCQQQEWRGQRCRQETQNPLNQFRGISQALLGVVHQVPHYP